MNLSVGLLSLLLIMMASLSSQETKKVIFFGDSITRNGMQPGGYIMRLGDMASKEGKSEELELIGAGIGGNKVYDLYLRLEDDVLSKKPDIVFVYVGVNDVWHRKTYGTGTDIDKFEKFYNALIAKFAAAGVKLALVTPAVIGEKTDHSNGLDTELNEVCVVIRNLAKANNLPLVDLRKAFLDHNRRYNPSNKESGVLTTDGVHLSDAGNKLIAEEIWTILKNFK
jgi:isoamyl acetate esterase